MSSYNMPYYGTMLYSNPESSPRNLNNLRPCKRVPTVEDPVEHTRYGIGRQLYLPAVLYQFGKFSFTNGIRLGLAV